MTILNIDESL